jgi:hypothetical protein
VERILDLFAVIQNIEQHGTLGDDVPLEWVSVEQIYRTMPSPRLPKDQLRDFCEYQSEQGMLEKRTGKEKETRQAKAEYKVSFDGKRYIELYHNWTDPNFQKIKNLTTWTPGQKEKKSQNKQELD